MKKIAIIVPDYRKEKFAELIQELLKKDWVDNFNIEYGDYSFFVSGLQLEFTVEENGFTVSHLIDVYKDGVYVDMEPYYEEKYYNIYHKPVDTKRMIEIIRDALEVEE